jgi:MerR family transcriptional regulator, mercuric resistance operon regulatory protein
MNYTIGSLAQSAGVGVETVRYYQRRGLLAVPATAAGSVRRYGAEDVRRLRFIKSAQAAGFTLAEIGDLLAVEGDRDRGAVRALALKRIGDLDRKISELSAARTALSRLASDCAAREDAGQAGCPILTAFDPVPHG